MDNASYVARLRKKWPEITDEAVANVLARMESYGENHWWEGTDPRALGYYQLREEMLLAEGYGAFLDGLGELLGRPIWNTEPALNHEGLLRETEAAWQGIPYSEECKREAERDGLRAVLKAAGDKAIIVQLDDAKQQGDE